jgi:hypothetical protein
LQEGERDIRAAEGRGFDFDEGILGGLYCVLFCSVRGLLGGNGWLAAPLRCGTGRSWTETLKGPSKTMAFIVLGADILLGWLELILESLGSSLVN